MFIGHFAAAFAARKVAPRPSLGWLIAACQWPDLVWPLLCLAGVERFRVAPGDTAFTPMAFDAYPWSHSLLMDVAWGALLGLAYFTRHKDRQGAATIGLLVVSHWVLDWVTHRPDMPLTPFSDQRYGLGLWNNVAATIVIETLMFAVGIWLYVRSSSASDRSGRYGFWGLVAFLAVMYVGSTFGPPPPSPLVVSIGTLPLWALLPLGAWIDRHRRSGAAPAGA